MNCDVNKWFSKNFNIAFLFQKGGKGRLFFFLNCELKIQSCAYTYSTKGEIICIRMTQRETFPPKFVSQQPTHLNDLNLN